MSWLAKLFGGGAKAAEQSEQIEIYQGFSILADPQKDAGGYRVHAVISKEIAGETRTHTLIRADTFAGYDEVKAISLRKAKQMIDEQGDALLK